jgi:two-component system, cell cycle sensor histidine kinase and response regulator CckA
VEDDGILRGVLPRVLDRLGYSFLMAESPDDALRTCRQPEPAIDVVLTDLVMPGMNGTELWEQIRALRPSAKVVFMSGYTADVISRQGIQDGSLQFIQKPFSMSDLGRKLQKVIAS